MERKKDTPFWDERLTDEERIDWLLSAMTLEEKLSYVTSYTPDLERLGIPGVSVGGEAAHGVEQRNDQNGIGKPDISTSFPQPIGMSMSWDTELIKEAGEVVGKEARVISHRHPYLGLSRWAPTVDMERDPRWGRNEEGYGEDPVLTGAMAGAYIKGMQGDDKRYLRIAATLKHFYANNTEVGRGWKNSSIDPRNQYEYYLEPFRRCIEDAGAEGVMTAYNRINGTVGVLNHEVIDILKNKYGLTHVVSDGGAVELVVNLHHEFGQHAETVAAVLKAGVDGLSGNPNVLNPAMEEAYELGLISEADVDRAIRSMMRTKLRLGVFDRHDQNPYDKVTEADIDSEENRKVCLQLSRNSLVLLKNKNDFLPLDPSMNPDDIALIGPMADAWYTDWYGGAAPYKKTLRQGLSELLKTDVAYADGLDRVILKCKGKGVAVDEEGRLVLADAPDRFIKENYGEGSYTFKHERTGKYLCVRNYESGSSDEENGLIAADRTEAFDWFVTEIMHIEDGKDGQVKLLNRFHYPIYINENGFFVSMNEKEEGTDFTIELVEDGKKKAAALAKEKKVVILALGCNSMINAKEEIDRNTLDLPDEQAELLNQIAEANPNTVLALFANYPYAISDAKEKLPAILLSATGSQDMGRAMAEGIFGVCAPAGRLNMTWYESEKQLPSIDDYDIIQGKRTYRYFDGPVLYPFGYGLTYTKFCYEDMQVKTKDKKTLLISLKITNIGTRTSDEVVQIYAAAPKSRVQKPISQLIAFTREHEIAPGETRNISLAVPISELRFYDTISGRLMVEEGNYRILAGASAKEAILGAMVFVPGEHTTKRDMSKRIRADHYDSYENMTICEGHIGYKGLELLDPQKAGRLVYRDCDLSGAYSSLELMFKSVSGCQIEVLVDESPAGSFEGDTRTNEQKSNPVLDRFACIEKEARIAARKPIYDTIEIPIRLDKNAGDHSTLELRIKGDISLCCLRMKGERKAQVIQTGIAN